MMCEADVVGVVIEDEGKTFDFDNRDNDEDTGYDDHYFEDHSESSMSSLGSSSLYADLAFMMFRADINKLRTSEAPVAKDEAALTEKQQFQAPKIQSRSTTFYTQEVVLPNVKPRHRQPPVAANSNKDNGSALQLLQKQRVKGSCSCEGGGNSGRSNTDETEDEEGSDSIIIPQEQQSCDHEHAALPECVVLPECFVDSTSLDNKSDHISISIQSKPRSVDRGERMIMTVSRNRSRARTPPPRMITTLQFASPSVSFVQPQLLSNYDTKRYGDECPLLSPHCNGNGVNNTENFKNTTQPPRRAKSTPNLNGLISESSVVSLQWSFMSLQCDDDDDDDDDESLTLQTTERIAPKRILSGDMQCSENAMLLTVDKLKERTEQMEEDHQFLLMKIEQLQLRVLELETSLEDERAAHRRSLLRLPQLPNGLTNLYKSTKKRSILA